MRAAVVDPMIVERIDPVAEIKADSTSGVMAVTNQNTIQHSSLAFVSESSCIHSRVLLDAGTIVDWSGSAPRT